MKYKMRGIEYEMPETIKDKEEYRRLEWLMKNSRDLQIARQANLLVGEYESIIEMNKNKQWEILHQFRDTFVYDIKGVMRLYIKNRERANEAFWHQITQYFKDEAIYMQMHSNSRYQNEIWAIVLKIAGREVKDDAENPYKLSKDVMDIFIEQGRQERWYQIIKAEEESEINAKLTEQGIALPKPPKKS